MSKEITQKYLSEKELTRLTTGNKKAVLVLVIFDESGSMLKNKHHAIEQLNNFKNNLQDADDGILYLIQIVTFADESKVLLPLCDVSAVKDITKNDYTPKGLTRLWKTVHEMIAELPTILKRVKKKTNCHLKTQICIITDGFDNQSNVDEDSVLYPYQLQKSMKKTLQDPDINSLTIAIGLSKQDVCKGLGTPNDPDHAIEVAPSQEGLIRTCDSMTQSTMSSFHGGYVPKIKKSKK